MAEMIEALVQCRVLSEAVSESNLELPPLVTKMANFFDRRVRDGRVSRVNE